VALFKYSVVSSIFEVIVLVKKYRRRCKDSSVPPSLEINIVLKKSGAYELRNFSMLALRDLEEYHSKVHSLRKWRLSKDEKRLFLE